MENIMVRKTPRRVSVCCSQCGDWDQINDRSHRRKLAEGKDHLCRMCRSVRTISTTDEDRNYWTSRFSQTEIDQMVGAILG